MDVQTHVATVVATAVDDAEEQMTKQRLQELEEELRKRTAQLEGERQRIQPPLVYARKTDAQTENNTECAVVPTARHWKRVRVEFLQPARKVCNKKALVLFCISLLLASVIALSVHFAEESRASSGSGPVAPSSSIPTSEPTPAPSYDGNGSVDPTSDMSDGTGSRHLATATIVGIVFAGIAFVFGILAYVYYRHGCFGCLFCYDLPLYNSEDA